MGLFGDLFDFNNDGRLDGMEEAMEFGFLMTMLEEDDDEDDDLTGFDPEDFDD